MEEVKIVLTYDEAKWIRDAIWSRIMENREVDERYDRENAPRWIFEQYIELFGLYNKITAAFYESE